MTASIDDRIVAMKMENTQFLRGVEQSLASYQKLETTLNKGISGKGLDGLSNNLRGFSLSPIENALSGVSRSWLAMSTIAVSALATVTSEAVRAGGNIAKSLSLDQIIGGFTEYSTNLTAIQTVLANTQAAGTDLDDVNAALQNLNHYSDKTIYNFGEMAKNIGTFTAAGVSLEGSVSAIKGIANLAALSGSSSEQASTAMYQLSQAIAAGRVSLQDWNSVVNAGMGGATFQRALAQTAEAMGTIDKSAINIDKSTGKMTINGASFRDSISAIGGEKWLTSDVLTNTLSQFTGDLTDAELAAQGFNKEQIKAIQLTAATASDAATKVKTIKQVFDVAKETVGSGWSLTFQRIFGDFEQARGTMTELSNFINKIIKHNSRARNAVLKDWGALGGRDKAITAITNAWKALMSVVDPIRDAFRDIFPAKTGQDLLDITKAINGFFRELRVGKDTGEDIRRTFRGFFAVLDIGKQIVGGIFGLIGDLFGVIGEGSGGILNFTGNVGDLLVRLDEWLKKTDAIHTFFQGLGAVLAIPIKLIGDLAGVLAGFFTGMDTGGLNDTGDALGRVSDRLSALSGIVDLVSNAWDRFLDFISAGVKLFAPFTQAITDLFSGLGDTFANSMDTGDFSPVLDIINTGLFGAITLLFAKFAKSGINFNLFGVGKGLTGPITALTGSLQAMQANIQADTLLKIGGAIALITASVVALSLIDSKALTKSLTALSIGFGQLLGAMAILVKISGTAGFVKVPAIAAAMVLLSTSILILTGAVAILAQLSWEELAKGLLGVGILLGFIAGFAASMSNASGPILRVGLAMLPLAIGLNIMAGAMLIFANMSWGEMAKGMVGVAGGLLIISGAMNLMPISMPLTAAGLLLVSIALNGIAASMMLFANLGWEEMGKGMVGIAGGLLLIAGAMQLMPISLPITAAGLVLVAAALNGIALASKTFATMSWEEMGKAAAALAGSLLIIAGGLTLMSGTLLGSAALLVAAAALAVLAPVLVLLGSMSWEAIAKGLVSLVGVFTVLGVAGLVLGPLVPVIFALSAAILLLGLGMALAGAGMLAFSIGLAALAGAGGAGMAVLKQGILEIVSLLPEIATALVLALLEMITAISDHAPEMIDAMVKLMGALLEGATKLLPKFGEFISKLIQTGLKVLVNYYDDLARAGLELIQRLLDAFADHVGGIADSATQLAINFINAMARNAVKFANAALDALVAFLNGLANAIETHSGQINAAGYRIARALIEGITQPIRDAAGEVYSAIQSIFDGIKSHVHLPHIDLNPLSRTNIDVYSQMAKKLGLVGGADSIRAGFDEINTALKDGIAKSNDIISKDKDKLKKLTKAGKGGSDEADKLRKELKAQSKLRDELQNEQSKWNKKMKDERETLIGLGKQYDALMKKISDAQDALDDITKKRDDIANNFNSTPDITSGMSLQSYLKQIQKKTEQTKKFMETLQALRALGLSDAAYSQLLAEGTDAQHLMDQLLAGGQSSVINFNSESAALTAQSLQLADQAAQELYHTGVVAAQGLLDGLNSQVPALEAQMNVIAVAMIKAIKKALKMKSPSRAFFDVGTYSTDGLSGGLKYGISSVEKASEAVGLASLETLQTTLNKASGMSLDLVPVVRPVLDLTQLQREATKIGTMLETRPIVAVVSFENASRIADARQVAQEAQQAVAVAPSGPPNVEINHTYNTPKAPSAVDVYRNDKSMIPLVKEALKS